VSVETRAGKTWREILRGAFDAYGANFRAFFLIALATVPVQVLGAVLTDRIESDETASLVMLPIQFANTLVFLVVTAAIIHGANLVASGSPVEAGVALDEALSRFGAIVFTQFLYAILVLASLVAFPYTAYRYWQDIQRNEPRGFWTIIGVILGAFLYFSVRWAFTTQNVMLEGRRNWAALDGSAEVVVGQWWRTLGITIVLSLALMPASFVAATSVYLPALAGATIASIALAVALPIVIIGQTFLYLDLKGRKQSDAISTD
jgi:hypothetical protein